MKVAEVGFAACAGRARSGRREGSTCAGNGAHGGCVQFLKDGKMMKQQTMPRRLLCAVCAVVLLVLAVPAAWAAEPDADTAAPVQSLTASEATEMQQGRRRRYRPDRQCGLRRHVGGGPQGSGAGTAGRPGAAGAGGKGLHLCRRGKRHGELLLQLRRAGRHPAGGPG